MPSSRSRYAGLLSVLLSGGLGAAVAAPTSIHVLRKRTSYDHTASKFTYYTSYTCYFAQYWSALAEPEPLRTQLAKQRALASTPPVSTYSNADEGEVEEYFAPGRYVRFERSTSFVPADRGACAVTRVDQTKMQLAQGTRLINATTKNGITTVSESPLPTPREATGEDSKQAGAALTQVAPAWGGGFAPGTVGNAGEKVVAGEACDLKSSSGSVFGMAIELCVWRGLKSFPTPLGPREIVLFSETRPSRAIGPTNVTDPIALDTAEILHWTEQATAFDVDAAFADSIFTPPQASK